MENRHIYLNPTAMVAFTFEEIRALFIGSQGHYDSKCRSLSAPFKPAPGGGMYSDDGYSLLTGMLNRTVNGTSRKGMVEVELSSREVDTLAKVAESPDVPTEIGLRLHRIHRELSEAWKRANPTKAPYEEPDENPAEPDPDLVAMAAIAMRPDKINDAKIIKVHKGSFCLTCAKPINAGGYAIWARHEIHGHASHHPTCWYKPKKV